MQGIKTTTISILTLGLLAGSAVGVAAQDEASMEVVTGQANHIEGMVAEPMMGETPAGIGKGEGLVVVHAWDTSDPRLNGDMTRTVNFMFMPDFAGGVESFAYELTNDGGSWVGHGSGFGSGDVGGGSVTLSGRDGYEGLTAYVVHEPSDAVDAWGLEGIIFPGAMPAIPELPTE